MKRIEYGALRRWIPGALAMLASSVAMADGSSVSGITISPGARVALPDCYAAQYNPNGFVDVAGTTNGSVTFRVRYGVNVEPKSNLDEYVYTRGGGFHQQYVSGLNYPGPGYYKAIAVNTGTQNAVVSLSISCR
ncbi:hypothetical protein [Tahibacter amnicola]|uniref:Uncharacterized protein n=1 Tax=Tahibacter amnicola TaxID=2976241 RepID=A0ABY6BBU7_9GAMM|nr:hypothetical protein [Tahibacter amnicola]UXI67523.1 hypothetical protein N4264_22740 [Tahibacter amnicola]